MQKADNDILAIQKELDGRMALMGGIETSIVDTEDATMDRGLYKKGIATSVTIPDNQQLFSPGY